MKIGQVRTAECVELGENRSGRTGKKEVGHGGKGGGWNRQISGPEIYFSGPEISGQIPCLAG